MLSCAEAREVVFDLIDGELDERSARAVEEHRDSCTNCPPLVEAILALLEQLRDLPEVDPDGPWLDRLLVTFEGPSNGRMSSTETNWPEN